MRAAPRQVGIDLREKRRPLCHEPPQHCVDEPGRALLAQDTSCIDRCVRTSLRGIARVFDLVGGGDEQLANLAIYAFGAGNQSLKGWRKPEIPASAPKRNRAYCRAIWQVDERCE